MKTLIKLFTIAIVIFAGVNPTAAQTTSQDADAVIEAAVNKMIRDTNFVFEATHGRPLRGGQQQLDYGYRLKVTKDSVIVFLPYFKKAVTGPNYSITTEGSIIFTSTDFIYKILGRKYGYRGIMIRPGRKNKSDWKDIQQLRVNISSTGHTNLDVVSDHRGMLFFGDIDVTEKQ